MQKEDKTVQKCRKRIRLGAGSVTLISSRNVAPKDSRNAVLLSRNAYPVKRQQKCWCRIGQTNKPQKCCADRQQK